MSKNEQMSDALKKISDSLICLFLVSEMSDSLTSLISSERTEQIAHGRSFLVSNLNDSLTSLSKKEGMSESLIFLNKKTCIKQAKNKI